MKGDKLEGWFWGITKMQNERMSRLGFRLILYKSFLKQDHDTKQNVVLALLASPSLKSCGSRLGFSIPQM